MVLETKKGKEFLNKKYKPLFPWFAETDDVRFICIHDKGDYISVSDGTGIVHFAPAFGAEDADVCTPFGLFGINPIDPDGHFGDMIPELKGKYFRSDEVIDGSKENNVNQWVLENLGDQLFKREQIRHSYPHCWRTECALMYRGVETWFVKVSEIKKRMIELNGDINWLPEHLKHGRFGKILEGAPDWAISRNRYWGAPIPVWVCDKTGTTQVVTSRAELEYLTGKDVPDMHKHNIDKLTWKNEITEGTMKRIPEVLDCWFESGSMPYGSTHYPYKRRKSSPHDASVYVARHGESENNLLEMESCKFETQTRFGLVYPGRQQCVASAKELKEKGLEFDLILSSPFRRTVETAQIFQSFCGGELLMDERLKETDIGDFDLELYDDVTEAIQNQPINVPFENGESIQDVYDRMQSVWDEVLEKHKGKRVLLVTHGSPFVEVCKIAEGKKPSKLGGMDELPKNGEVRCLTPDAEVSAENPIEEFPSADFIAEGLDQTRGWFYSLHVLACALLDKPVYKNVITNGIVLAEDGNKMSKSKKNYPDPMEVFNTLGADATRFYMLSSPVVKGENFKFAERGVQEIVKSVLLPLRSAYQFFSLYANIDNWKPTTFCLIRHGEGEHNVAGVYSGQVGNKHHLTEAGKEQVVKTAKSLPKFDVLVHSPFVRTKETKDIIVKETGFKGEVIEDARVQESDFGVLEGKRMVGRKHRLISGIEGAESLESLRNRVAEFQSEMTQKYPGKTIGVATHGDVFSVFHMLINDVPASDVEQFSHMPMAVPAGVGSFYTLPETENELDKWILSEMQNVCKKVQNAFDAYDIETGLREIAPFVEKLNNWYLRRSRKRFWASGMNPDKEQGYQTLHYILYTLAKLMAPACPFFAERLFQDLGGLDSVHLEYFPQALDRYVDEQIGDKVTLEREIAGLAAGIRAEKKIKLRQPLQKIRFSTTLKAKPDLDIVCEEANVKEVEILEKLDGIAQPIIRVNARMVGKKFGPKVQELIKAGKAGDFKDLADGKVEVAGEVLELGEYERGYLCEEGVEAASTAQTVVLLDTEISEDLECEGFAREIIRAVQDLRKKSGFDVSDRININYATDSQKLQKAISENEKMISGEVLAHSIVVGKGAEEFDMDGEKISISLSK